MESDTIYYGNGEGYTCTSSMGYLKVGKQVIIKSVEKDVTCFAWTQPYPSTDEKLNRFSSQKKELL